MTNTNIITTNNLCKNYGVGDNAVRALKNCNIEIHTGESVAVTGASGSGKSTLINEILYKSVANKVNRSRMKPGKHKEIKRYRKYR